MIVVVLRERGNIMPKYKCICDFCGHEAEENRRKDAERTQRCPECRTWNWIVITKEYLEDKKNAEL